MKITRNSAKCTACGEEIVSTHRHDFVVHYCRIKPEPGLKWVHIWFTGHQTLVPSGKETYRFAVDGGNEYLRRLGSRHAYVDTSTYEAEAGDEA
jgi:hypothetical protein